MRCFTSLVESRFLKKATKELTSARTQLLKDDTATNHQRPAIIRWSFASKEKRRQFKIVWTAFGMDDHVCEGSDFLLDDYVSIVEDDDIAIICSVDKKLVDQGVVHYHNVHGDWCYYRTKKRIANKYVYVAVMWSAFPTAPFSLN